MTGEPSIAEPVQEAAAAPAAAVAPAAAAVPAWPSWAPPIPEGTQPASSLDRPASFEETVAGIDLPAASPMEYQLPTYAAGLVTLLARLDVERLCWVGTSLGGLLGMTLAAAPGTPVHALVLNDVGPRVGAAALARIGSYVGSDPVRIWNLPCSR